MRVAHAAKRNAVCRATFGLLLVAGIVVQTLQQSGTFKRMKCNDLLSQKYWNLNRSEWSNGVLRRMNGTTGSYHALESK